MARSIKLRGISGPSRKVEIIDEETGTVVGQCFSDESGRWEIKAAAVSDGAYSLRAKAHDPSGIVHWSRTMNVAVHGESITVDGQAIDTVDEGEEPESDSSNESDQIIAERLYQKMVTAASGGFSLFDPDSFNLVLEASGHTAEEFEEAVESQQRLNYLEAATASLERQSRYERFKSN